jgi:hypothetical protein
MSPLYFVTRLILRIPAHDDDRRFARRGWGVIVRLDLTDEETLALLNILTETIENDRYPLSPCIRTLRGILAKFGPIGPATPSPPRPPTPEERDPRRALRAGRPRR